MHHVNIRYDRGGNIVPPVLNLSTMLLYSKRTNRWCPVSSTAGCQPVRQYGEEKNLLLSLGVKTWFLGHLFGFSILKTLTVLS